MKRIIITALLAFFCISNMQAGKNRGKVITPQPSPIPKVAIGGGTSMPSNNAKDKAFLSNSTAISIDASIPITKRGWGPNGNWFGVNIGGSYNVGGKGGFGTTQNPYAITGQTSSIVADRGGAPADPGFRMGAGPQANFHFGRFMVSPMLLGEYFSMTRKEMSSVQTTQYNGQNYDFTLATLPQTKTSGFAVTPKLRLQYMFSNRFGLFADASYTTGPKVETQITKLIPNGAANQQGTYEIQALQNASYVKGETKTTRYSATGINFGVVIGLGGISHTKDLSNDLPKHCTCCGQNGHTNDVCIIPCIAKVSAPLPGEGHVVLTPECCVDPVTGRNTGLIRFKMTGSLVYAAIKVTSGTGYYLTENIINFVNNTYTDCLQNPVKFEYVPNYSTPGMTANSTMNGVVTNTYTYNRRFGCFRVKDIYMIKIDLGEISVFHGGPFRPTDGLVGTEAVTWTLDDFNGFRLNGSGTGKDGEQIDMSCPVGIDEETGKIFLTGTPEITKTVNGKTSKIKSDYKPTQKRDYVGHVTLLK